MAFFGQTFGQQQQANQPANPGFAFNSGAPNTSFGTNPTAPASNPFGANTAAPAGGAFGSFGNTNSGLTGFGNSSFSAFNSNVPSTGFGSNASGPNAFGAPAMVTSGFGDISGNAMAIPPNRGTGDPTYSLTQDSTASDGGNFQSICCMPAYKDYSVDELRLQDYKMGKITRGTGLGSGANVSFGGNQSLGTTNAFGSTNTGSLGFGSQNTAFGNAQGSMFGANKPAFGTSTTTFGGVSTGTGAPTGFNSTAPTATSGFGSTTGFGIGGGQSGFGQTSSTFGGLGNTQTAAPTTGLGFGNTAPQTSVAPGTTAFGAFGAGTANTANKPMFGGLAGNTGGNMFGNNATSMATSIAPTTSGFGFNLGAPVSTATGFGANTANKPATPFGGATGFGTTPQTTAPAFGGGAFGSQSGITTGTTSAFGTTPAPALSQPFGTTKPALSFGNTTTSMPATGGLFGSTNPGTTTNAFQLNTNAPPKPAAPFGAGFGTTALTAPGTTTGFGNAFAPKLGAPTTSGVGTGGFNTGLGGFGTMTGLNMQPQQQQQQQQPQQQQMAMLAASQIQPVLTASVDQKPYGQTPLFDLVPESVIKTVKEHPLGASLLQPKKANIDEEATRDAAMSMSSLVKIPPSQITRSRLRMSGFHETSSLSQPYALTRSTSGSLTTMTGINSMDMRLNTPRTIMNGTSANDTSSMILPPPSFTPRSSVKRLEVRSAEPAGPSSTPSRTSSSSSSSSVFAVPSRPSGGSSSIFSRSVMSDSGVPTETPSKPPRGSATVRGLAMPSMMPPVPYEITPNIMELQAMTKNQLKSVNNLTISHEEYGSVIFLEPVDLTEVDIMELCGKIVQFVPGEFVLYGDDQSNNNYVSDTTTTNNIKKRALDVPACVTLKGKWPRTKTRQAVKHLTYDDPMFIAYIDRLKSVPGLQFKDYDYKTGSWTFIINPNTN